MARWIIVKSIDPEVVENAMPDDIVQLQYLCEEGTGEPRIFPSPQDAVDFLKAVGFKGAADIIDYDVLEEEMGRTRETEINLN